MWRLPRTGSLNELLSGLRDSKWPKNTVVNDGGRAHPGRREVLTHRRGVAGRPES